MRKVRYQTQPALSIYLALEEKRVMRCVTNGVLVEGTVADNILRILLSGSRIRACMFG